MNFKCLCGENVTDTGEEWIFHQANALNQLPVQSKHRRLQIESFVR